MKLISDSTLSHYGIPGQKKGIRRWQYEDGRFNEEGKIRYFGPPKRKKTLSDIKSEVSGIEPSTISLLVYSTFLLGYSLFKKYEISSIPTLEKLKSDIKFKKNVQSKEPNNEITKEIESRRLTEKFDENLGLYIKNKKTSVEEDMKNNNPYYSTDKDFGNKMNCVYCSGSYILRRAGFDSIAHYNRKGVQLFNLKKNGDNGEYSKELFKSNVVSSWTNPFTNKKDFKKLNKKEYRDKTFNQFASHLNKLKNGEASIISMQYPYGGHYLNAEKINNKVYIIDSQSNKKYTIEEFQNIVDKYGAVIANCTNINYKNLNTEVLNKNIINHIAHKNI